MCQHIPLHPSSVFIMWYFSLFVLQCAATNHVYLRLLCYVTDMVRIGSGMQEYRPLVVPLTHYTSPLRVMFWFWGHAPPPFVSSTCSIMHLWFKWWRRLARSSLDVCSLLSVRPYRSQTGKTHSQAFETMIVYKSESCLGLWEQKCTWLCI